MREETPKQVIILGSGTSTGVPVIGCSCPICTSEDSRNKRTRASVLVRYADGTTFIIDTGPDFRQQMLREGVSSVDAILYTHLHADHCHGFDDVRALNFRRQDPVPCFLTAPHSQEVDPVADSSRLPGHVEFAYDGMMIHL